MTMPKQCAFYFDSSACSGCKACQMACKDKHGLHVGLLWRRVYEVTGGGWARRGEAWLSSVFAYNVSLACNHCYSRVEPKIAQRGWASTLAGSGPIASLCLQPC